MKKIIPIILSAVIMTSSAYAAEAEAYADLKGVFEAHNPVEVSHNLEGETMVSWQTSTAKEGVYAEVSTETEYLVSYKDSGKWLKAVLTYSDGTIETEPMQIKAVWNKKLSATALPNGAAEKTSMSDKFTVDGMEFVLLDITDSSNSKFLVVTADTVGERAFSEISSEKTGFKRQHFYDMAAFLNNLVTVNAYRGSDTVTLMGEIDYTESGYLGNEEYIQIPEMVLKYINNKHVWKIEPAKTGANYEYCVEAGIVLPAVTEIEKYSDILGWKDTDSYWTRTPSNTNDGEVLYVDAEGEKGKINNKVNTEKLQIRPEFYLSEDFFRDVKLQKAGKNVMEKISKIYTKEELLRLYTEQELDEIGYKDCFLENLNFTDGDITSSSVEIEYLCGEGEAKESKIMICYYSAERKLVGVYAKNISTQLGHNKVEIETPNVSPEAALVGVVMLDKKSLQPMADSILK